MYNFFNGIYFIFQFPGCAETYRDSTTGQSGFLTFRTDQQIAKYASVDPQVVITDRRSATLYKSTTMPDLMNQMEDIYWYSTHLYAVLGELCYKNAFWY